MQLGVDITTDANQVICSVFLYCNAHKGIAASVRSACSSHPEWQAQVPSTTLRATEHSCWLYQATCRAAPCTAKRRPSRWPDDMQRCGLKYRVRVTCKTAQRSGWIVEPPEPGPCPRNFFSVSLILAACFVSLLCLACNVSRHRFF